MHVNDILDRPDLQDLRERFERNFNRGEAHECWLWHGQQSKEYGCFRVDRKHPTASRVAWVMAHGKMPETTGGKPTWVLHECDKPLCVNPAHLFLGNRQTNVDDMVTKRRHVFGSRSSQARLTETDVETILDSAEPCRALAARFGVGYYTVLDIRHRKIWAHVRPGQPANQAYLQRSRRKLTAADAIAIFSDPRPRAKIAAAYGIDPSHVRDIHYGKHWAKTTGWTKTLKRR